MCRRARTPHWPVLVVGRDVLGPCMRDESPCPYRMGCGKAEPRPGRESGVNARALYMYGDYALRTTRPRRVQSWSPEVMTRTIRITGQHDNSLNCEVGRRGEDRSD